METHPKDLAKRLLGGSQIVGIIDESTLGSDQIVKSTDPISNILVTPTTTKQGEERSTGGEMMPPLGTILNSFDFESLAKKKLSKEAWAYYSSGSDDEITLRENRAAFLRVWLVPRIMVNVKQVSFAKSMCGFSSSLPLYISATALGKLADPEGEVAIIKAAHRNQIPYMLPTLSSCSLQEMLDAIQPGQVVWSQLYVNANRERTLEYVEELKKSGKVTALFVTVDAPQLGRREKDMRTKFTNQKIQNSDNLESDKGVTRAISTFIDPSLSWDDLPWLKKICGSRLKLILKGVQCKEDLVLAWEKGCDGVVLSNHGGRQCDTCRSSLEILDDCVQELKKRVGEINNNKFEIFIDGGIRRGADIFKAIALGASGVGIGRPVLFSLASYGGKGIDRLINNFKDEMEMTMRLMGTSNVRDIKHSHVISKDLSNHSYYPTDYLAKRTYEPLNLVSKI